MSITVSVGIARYRRLLREPGAWTALVLGTIARLPIGMTGLALLLLVQQQTGSFAVGGAVSAAYAAALAAAAPVRGSAIDRRGARTVLLTYGAAHPAALVAVLVAVTTGLALPVVLALTVVAGATFPPVGPLVRTLWGVLYEDEGDRTTAYALDAVLVELAFIGGPLFVGVAIALASPAAAIVGAAALVGAGSLLLARTAVAARVVPHPDLTRVPLRAPLLAPPVRRLLLALLLLGVAFGAIEVAVAAHAVSSGASHLVGPILALWATGSAVGGLVYGARDWGAAPHRQYPWLVGLLAAGLALPLAALDSVTLAALLLCGGAAIAPFAACNSALLARTAPPGTSTATFAWSASGIVAGIAAGTAGAGWVVEHLGGTGGFGLAALAGLLALATAVTGRNLLLPPVRT